MEPRRDEAPGLGTEGSSRQRASLARVGGRGAGAVSGACGPAGGALLLRLLHFPCRAFCPLRALFQGHQKGLKLGAGGIPRVVLSARVRWEMICRSDRSTPRGWLQSRFSEPPTPKPAGSAGVNIGKGGSPKGPRVSGSPAPLGLPFSGSQRQVGARPPCPQAVEQCAGQEGCDHWSQSHRRYPRLPSP